MSVVAFDGIISSFHVIVHRFSDERNFIEWGCGGKVVNHSQVKGDVNLFCRLPFALWMGLVKNHLVILGNENEMRMATGDDGGGLVVLVIAANNFDI